MMCKTVLLNNQLFLELIKDPGLSMKTHFPGVN